LKVLLDTHLFLWAVSGNRRLSSAARARISAAESVYVSAASIWEVAIKARLGKIERDPGGARLLVERKASRLSRQ